MIALLKDINFPKKLRCIQDKRLLDNYFMPASCVVCQLERMGFRNVLYAAHWRTVTIYAYRAHSLNTELLRRRRRFRAIPQVTQCRLSLVILYLNEHKNIHY